MAASGAAASNAVFDTKKVERIKMAIADGQFPTLSAVIDHYDTHFALGLTPNEKADLLQYLRSL